MKGKIDGGKIAAEIEKELEKTDRKPRLEIVLVGDHEASRTFVNEKLELAQKINFEAHLTELAEDVDERKLLKKIEEFNKDQKIDGILIQLPLPDHIDENKVFSTLSPRKDVDGLTPENLGKLVRGNPAIRPAAVEGILTLLKARNIELKSENIVVVNNSVLIGRPLGLSLGQEGATVTLCHEKTENLGAHLSSADIIVTATGKQSLIEPSDVETDCVVIDAGYESGQGDIPNPEEFARKSLIAPVPNGLGPVTVACTMKNLLKLHRNL
ncbi:bifunctional 5,10-methylenetetrahydrofolate dehydrogenase/5,10-methenyltetrahydrofolate cyclohydrolase [Candidatus Nanohalococcus occultus]|uniref:Bifunctional protein FolD n=1 Tax=Candidatus Nanohalococcus occultus TaxID=2978047 RepID=A0ABY8CJK9_9ARCH|nr:Methylenetetrahydrofolate dehydrogenase (NADP) / Methenyltetrahydrofolate cyclohydrolase [Candidatus Nanohaloarchaeota archaeon SVXNc]